MRDFSLERLAAMYAQASQNVFWRHDVDVSPEAAVQMAAFEAERGIHSTFYVMTTSPFYPANESVMLAAELVNYGHDVGLHLQVDEVVTRAELLGCAVSFHRPNDFVLWRDFADIDSAYAFKWRGRYISDSRGVFAHGDPEDRFDGKPLQVNLHPEWWFEKDWADGIDYDTYREFFGEPHPHQAMAAA